MKRILLALACTSALAGCEEPESTKIKEVTASADSNYLIVPKSGARIFKFYDPAGVLCFVVNAPNGGAAIFCVPAESGEEEVEIHPIPGFTEA